MKKIFILIFILLGTFVYAQERMVEVNFESSSFNKNPTIPYNKAFVVQGEVLTNIDYVTVDISYENKDKIIESYQWKRGAFNNSGIFKVVIPGKLQSNTSYDFTIKTYRILSTYQKEQLKLDLEERIKFFLQNNMSYNGKNVEVNNPKRAYEDLQDLVDQSLAYYNSKNGIYKTELSELILNQLKLYNDFKFKNLLRKKKGLEENEVASKIVKEKIEVLAHNILNEIEPYLNSDIVQLDQKVKISSVETDKERFSLPINFGLYAWSKNTSINEESVNNLDFTPGVGFTIPFSNKSSFIRNSNLVDSFGFSAGVLLESIKDANGVEYVTPGVDLPVYTGLGLRFFKVLRLNVGTLITAEKGTENFDNLTFMPTASLALELNLWIGIKK